MSELVPTRGPLSRSHRQAVQLGEAAEHPAFHRDLLYGRRGIKRPMVALTTKKELGNCRHALSQMVVAGVMTVHPPMRPGERSKDAAAAEPRVLTFTPPPPRDAEAEPQARPAPRAVVPSPPPKAPGPPPTARTPRAERAPNRVDLGDRVLTFERRTVEDFNPHPTEDED